MGGQEHFYFETNAAFAKPVDNCREMEVHSSCQNVAHAQHSISHALGVGMNNITVRTKRLGGGFGGKEARFHLLTSAIAVAGRVSKFISIQTIQTFVQNLTRKLFF